MSISTRKKSKIQKFYEKKNFNDKLFSLVQFALTIWKRFFFLLLQLILIKQNENQFWIEMYSTRSEQIYFESE